MSSDDEHPVEPAEPAEPVEPVEPAEPAEGETPAVLPSTTARPTKLLRALSILVMIAGAILIVAGAVTWFVVRDQLADEKIVVSDDAERFAGDDVDGPLTAYTEAETIEKHALEASDGLTYAELDRDDPVRETVMTASFLRASLFTSVVSFGVAAFAFGTGVVMIIIGYVLLRLSKLVTAAPGSLEPAA
jgi:hypothetical protein